GFDPTPRAITLAEAPRIIAWVDLVEDLSGMEPADTGWIDRATAATAFRPLLEEIGRVYAPFLLANADALQRGATEVACTIDGKPWTQRPFPYQGKCLQALRAAYDGLRDANRPAAAAALAGTGCETLFAG